MKRRPLPRVHDLGSMEAPVTVVGDVHLSAREPEVAQRFVRFLDETSRRGGTLVLLGDLFDWWVGRRQAERSPFARAIVDALVAVSARGVRLTFVQGNRDYPFDGAAGLDLEVWPDVVRTTWGGRRVVLSHGDLLCSADRGYLQMRGKLRSPLGRAVLAGMPYPMKTYVARGLRDVSNRSVRRKSGVELGIDYGLAREWLEAYEADTLVVGHVHTGVHHRLTADPRRDVYVLKDWSRAGNAVLFDGSSITMRAV